MLSVLVPTHPLAAPSGPVGATRREHTLCRPTRGCATDTPGEQTRAVDTTRVQQALPIVADSLLQTTWWILSSALSRTGPTSTQQT